VIIGNLQCDHEFVIIDTALRLWSVLRLGSVVLKDAWVLTEAHGRELRRMGAH